jgi:hypothetical protein
MRPPFCATLFGANARIVFAVPLLSTTMSILP